MIATGDRKANVARRARSSGVWRQVDVAQVLPILDGRVKTDAVSFRGNPAMRCALVATALVLAASRDTRAQQSDSRWTVVSPPNNEPTISFDKTQFRNTNYGVDTWVKYQWAIPVKTTDGKPMAEIISHNVYNCVMKRVTLIHQATYGPRGGVVDSFDRPYPTTDYGWQYSSQSPVPESIGEVAMVGVCKAAGL